MEAVTRKPITRKQRDFALRERDILDCTLELLAESELRDLSVEKIAKLTGIGKGTLYKHFECKDDLYAKLFLLGIAILLQQYRKIIADECLTGLQQMRAIIIYTLKYHQGNAIHRKIHLAFKQGGYRYRISDGYKLALEKAEKTTIELFSLALVKGIEDGEVNMNIPFEVLIMGLSSTFEGAIIHMQTSDLHKSSMCKLKDQFIPMMADYMMSTMIRDDKELTF